MKQKLCLLFCLFASRLVMNAQTTAVTIPGSQVQKISSVAVPQQDYELQIMLPAGYGKTDKKYPVVYLMDSQWDFPLVIALYGQQYYDGFVPELIIVGVTWTGKYSKPDSLRARDYTPTKVSQTPQSGGADAFLSFMKNELFPFVESRYSADKNNRVLMGCSFGGLFTLYAFFTQPDLFRGYVAASPAVEWDNEVLYAAEKKYFENKNKNAARLYMCVGGVERGVPVYQKFATHLINRQYPNLRLRSQVLENIGHSGTKGEGYERGLQFVFERPNIQLSAAQLKNISGTYKSAGGNTVAIQSTNNKPVLEFGANNRFNLLAASDNELYSTAEFLNLQLQKNEKGIVTGFVLNHYGGTQQFTKTN